MKRGESSEPEINKALVGVKKREQEKRKVTGGEWKEGKTKKKEIEGRKDKKEEGKEKKEGIEHAVKEGAEGGRKERQKRGKKKGGKTNKTEKEKGKTKKRKGKTIVAKALDGQRYPLPPCECMWMCEGERGSGPEGADDLCLVSF